MTKLIGAGTLVLAFLLVVSGSYLMLRTGQKKRADRVRIIEAARAIRRWFGIGFMAVRDYLQALFADGPEPEESIRARA